MGVHWTVLHVLRDTEGWDRQWDLKYRQGTYGCPLDCPVCPRDGIDSVCNTIIPL